MASSESLHKAKPHLAKKTVLLQSWCIGTNGSGVPKTKRGRAVAIDLQKEAPNVVTEAGFKMLVESGYSVEVVCKQDAYRKNSVWHGIWLLRAVNEDGVEKELVTARARPDGDFIQLRTFKTVTGLTSFLIDLGFSVVAFPVNEGQRWTYTLADTPEAEEESGS